MTEGVTRNYSYDKAGNLTNDGESTYRYDLQNRLMSKSGKDGTTTFRYDNDGNLISEISKKGTKTYEYNGRNRLSFGTNENGDTSEYKYNGLGVRVQSEQIRQNPNSGHQNIKFDNGSRYMKDYMPVLSEGRNTWQRVWETKVNSTVQNDPETITKDYVTDYTSVANRDIFVYEHGSYTQKYVYGINGDRLWAEFDYAEETKRGEPGENLASDFASVDIQKIWYRRNLTESTLFAVDENDEVINHVMYDDWGKPLTDLPPNQNYAGIDNINNYAGYTYDEVLELYFVQNRFYNAETRQFTQEDPIKDGANWYAYCEGNPLVRVDWYGLEVALVQIRNSSLKYNVDTSNINSLVNMFNLYTDASISGSGTGIVVYSYETKKKTTLQANEWKNASVESLLKKTGFKLADAKHKMAQGYFQKVQCQGKQNEYTINMFNYGSNTYLDMVEGLAYFQAQGGTKNTYSEVTRRVMRDINALNPQVFQSMSDENFKNLGVRFSGFMQKKGSVSREEHYFRNKLNVTYDLTKVEELVKQGAWKPAELEDAALHQNKQTPAGTPNKKWISEDGHYEAVFNGDKKLLTEWNAPEDMGTYNYAHPKNDPYGHILLDILPWIEYGNAPNDPTTKKARKEAAKKGALGKALEWIK